MKRVVTFFLFAFLTLSLNANEKKIQIGIITQNVQDSEGSGFTLGYKVMPDLIVDTSYNMLYLRGISNNKESWTEYQTQRLGIKYNLVNFMQNKMHLFSSVGLEYLYDNTDLTSETNVLNTYGTFGMLLEVRDSFAISFEMGSSGKGAVADKIQFEPNYAHGFNSSITAIYYPSF